MATPGVSILTPAQIVAAQAQVNGSNLSKSDMDSYLAFCKKYGVGQGKDSYIAWCKSVGKTPPAAGSGSGGRSAPVLATVQKNARVSSVNPVGGGSITSGSLSASGILSQAKKYLPEILVGSVILVFIGYEIYS